MAARKRESVKRGILVSLLFWFCLVVAAGLFSAVALALKMLTNLRLRNECRLNQHQLVAIEKQVNYLQRVAEALKNEPQFAEELVRIDFDAVRPGDERIAVDPSLHLDVAFDQSDSQIALPQQSSALTVWQEPVLQEFTENRRLRLAFLVSAGCITLLSFTFLGEPSS